ncbi:MAG: protein kinase [Acidobacteria bacterium]|nr:protein kinase [Acidobacteriota bacterium]
MDGQTAGDTGAAGGATISPGSVLKDRYQIEKELGRGGIGVVYLARDQQLLSKQVVIKVLLEQTASDPWFQKKFRQELEALARIDHPGVVGALDVGETPDGKPFLVMQFLEGVTLRSAIGQNGMEFGRAANILRQVGQALSAAHEKGVYHRDLKPENIMLQNLGDGEERARLIDFGIAAVRESQISTHTESSRIAGSFPYMPPEQLMGKAGPASDVYALGVIAYEMLTGQRPEVLPQGVSVKPRELRSGIPERAQEIIFKALSFSPELRYQRPRDLGDQLAQALTGSGVHSEAPVQAAPAALPPAAPSHSSGLEMAYVLFMDLVSFSTLSMDRQSQLVQQLQEIVRGTEEFRRAQAGGQLISLPTGDGMALVFFQNPVSAVQCAVEVARALRNQGEIKLRMGVHTGPVYRIADINTNRNVTGGGINLAQRVMDCGDAGHILLSKAVADILGQLSDWSQHLHDLGECEVKHGVKVHLVNFYTGDAGNPQAPEKLRRGKAPLPAVPHAGSHRTLYVVLGSAVTLAIIVWAAANFARRREPGVALPSAGASMPGGTSPSAPRPGAPPPAVPPSGSSPAVQQPAPAPPAAVVTQPRGQAPATRPGFSSRAAETGPLPQRQTEATPSQNTEQLRAARPPAQQPAAAGRAPDSAALQEQRERMIFLAARVAAVQNSLQGLQRQQNQSGLSMRSDMVAASQRVQYLMGEANAALSSRDAEAVKRNLDLAERDVEKLESFLGR